MNSVLRNLALILSLLYSSALFAEPIALKSFNEQSLKLISKQYAGQPFLMILWSLDCPACFDEFELLSHWVQKNPAANLVLISTDPVSQEVEVKKVLNEYQLAKRDNWIFSSQVHVSLRYAIDPNWYGELPRSYFFDQQHTPYAHSGVLSSEALTKIADLLTN